MKSCGAPMTTSTPVDSGSMANPTRPMSWYSGSHDTITSVSTSSSVAIAIASRLAQIVRFGSMTPLGSAVDPLVNCRHGESIRVVVRSFEVARPDAETANVVEQLARQHHRRIVRSRLDERREVGIDHDDVDVRVGHLRPASARRTPRSSRAAWAAAARRAWRRSATRLRWRCTACEWSGRATRHGCRQRLPRRCNAGRQLSGLVVQPADGHPIGAVAGHERDRASTSGCVLRFGTRG